MNDSTNLTEIVAEAVREYVGDGDGADEKVLAAYEQKIREQIAAEIEADRDATFYGRPTSSLTSHDLSIYTGATRAATIARTRKDT